MRILKLEINNIASIERASIDFGSGQLATDPIFLICGDTGTGKSTILNAICLALYNKVPCLESLDRRTADTEGVAINNPRQLMRRGTAQAEVVLTFEGNDLITYRATWEVHRARNRVDGALQPPQRILESFDTGMVLTAAGQIAETIERTVGLTFDEFTRTTMLAQGQFAAFMKAADNEKSDILEKLTGTGIYASIGRRIFELRQAKQNEVASLAAEINGTDLLDDDTRRQLSDRCTQMGLNASTLAADIAVLERNIAWLDRQQKLVTALSDANSAQQQAQQTLQSPEIRQIADTLHIWDATDDVRSALAEECRRFDSLCQVISDMRELKRNHIQRILSGLRWLDEAHAFAKANLSNLKLQYNSLAPRSAILAQAQRIDQLASAAVRNVSEAKAINDRQSRLSAQIDLSKKAELPLQQAVAIATNRVVDMAKAVDQCAKNCEGYDIKALSQQLTAATEREASTLRCRDAFKNWEQCREHLSQIEELLQSTEKSINEVNAEIKTCDAQLPNLISQYKYCEGRLRGLSDLNDHLASIRERFADSRVCPLCGSTDVELHTDHQINDMLRQAIDDESLAKQHLDFMQSKRADATTALATLSRTLTAQRYEHRQAATAISSALADLDKLGFDPTHPDTKSLIEASVADAVVAREEAKKRLAQAASLFSRLDEARQSLDSSREALANCTADYTERQQTTLSLIEQAERYASLARQAELASSESLASLHELASCDSITIDDVRAYADNVGRDAAMFIKLQADIVRVTSECSLLAQRIDSCRHSISSIGLTIDVSTTVASRLPDFEQAITEFSSQFLDLRGRIANARHAYIDLSVGLNRYFAAGNYTRRQINDLLALGQQSIDDMRRKLIAADDQAKKATIELSMIKHQFELHTAERPPMAPDADRDKFDTQRIDLVQQREAALVEQARCQSRLDLDAKSRASVEHKSLRLKTLQAELADWELLDSTFGGSDGKRFRNIAQSYVLRALLNKANYYLAMLSNRYLLQCDDGSLAINVIDLHHGGAVRHVGLLSGGESFIASLALALGLSVVSGSGVGADILFIDEGFGTLDSSTLEVVLETLDRLHQIGGRRIGVISHVAELKDRIPTQLRLVRSGPSSSVVQIHSL